VAEQPPQEPPPPKDKEDSPESLEKAANVDKTRQAGLLHPGHGASSLDRLKERSISNLFSHLVQTYS